MSRYLTSFMVLSLMAFAACSPRPEETPASSEAASEATASSLAPADYTSLANVMTCDWPVKKTDTAESLLATYKSYAQVTDVPGAEGITQKGVVLYGNDPRRKVEVFFFDEAMTEVSTVLIRGDSQWSGPKGLHLGSSIADVEAANEKPFTLGGLGRGYGGYVTDLNRGKLTKAGKQYRITKADRVHECVFGWRFGLMADGSEAAIGEGPLKSDDPAVVAAKPVLQEMTVSWTRIGDPEAPA